VRKGIIVDGGGGAFLSRSGFVQQSSQTEVVAFTFKGFSMKSLQKI
jgi:hypothetical protein